MRLVIGGVIKQILGSFRMEQIVLAFEKLSINMTPATNQQISALKRAGVIVMTVTQCPLISKRDAERLIAYLNANSGQVNFCNAETYNSVESNQSISSQLGYPGQAAGLGRSNVLESPMFDLHTAANLGPSVSGHAMLNLHTSVNLGASGSGRPMFDLQTATNLEPSVSGPQMFDLHNAANLGPSVSGPPIFDLHTNAPRQYPPWLRTGQAEPQLFKPAFDFNVQKFGDSMNYQLMIPKDLLDGIAPLKITDDSKELWKFYQVLDFMAHEKQVLILIDTDNIYGFAFRSLRQRFPKGSFIEHHRHKQNEIAATAWALDLQKPNTMKDPNQKKYLIGDWFSSAGFEAPAVIFITKYQDAANNATFCQRAKAKLVIYHVPKVNIYHHDVSNPRHSYHSCAPTDSMGNLIRSRDRNCNSCGEIKPDGTFSICLKEKVWTVVDLQGWSYIKDFLKPSQIQHLIDNSPPPCQGTKKSETDQPQKKINSINESELHSESDLNLNSDSESDSDSESESELNLIRVRNQNRIIRHRFN